MAKTILSKKEVTFHWNQANGNYNGSLNVEYDIDRPELNGGDILIRNGYFVHFISPEHLAPLPKNIIFVIDKSGSMEGDRIHSTKQAFKFIIADLKNGEKFNIIPFDAEPKQYQSDTLTVTRSTRIAALEFVENLHAVGSTNIFDAISMALDSTVDPNSANIIFLLSDGQTNKGLRDWNQIRSRVQMLNKKRFAIFTFAIGTKAPYLELEKLSIQNNGLARKIAFESNVELYVKDFYNYVAQPLIWNMKLQYTNAKKSILSQQKVFMGEEAVVVGELGNQCESPGPKLTGLSEGGLDLNDAVILGPIDCDPSYPAHVPLTNDLLENPTTLPADIDLERMYAYLQIRLWMTQMKGASRQLEQNLTTMITVQAIKYSFVTQFTSMVVEESIPRTPVAAARKSYGLYMDGKDGNGSRNRLAGYDMGMNSPHMMAPESRKSYGYPYVSINEWPQIVAIVFLVLCGITLCAMVIRYRSWITAKCCCESTEGVTANLAMLPSNDIPEQTSISSHYTTKASINP